MMKWIITEGRVGSYASESGDRAARTKQREGRVAVEKITRVLPKLMGRLKPVTSPASRCFLVALFILGFTTSYFANPPSKTLPQNPAGFDVEYHPPKPAIVSRAQSVRRTHRAGTRWFGRWSKTAAQ